MKDSVTFFFLAELKEEKIYSHVNKSLCPL